MISVEVTTLLPVPSRPVADVAAVNNSNVSEFQFDDEHRTQDEEDIEDEESSKELLDDGEEGQRWMSQ